MWCPDAGTISSASSQLKNLFFGKSEATRPQAFKGLASALFGDVEYSRRINHEEAL
jgi:hypothetical protein